jgi:hypothetical protein
MADDFAPQVATLAGGVPIALLPIRLEARFFNVGAELRVRIFPDQVHLDAHEIELTAVERDAGIAYWRARFASPNPAARTTNPWTALCSIIGAQRAIYVVRALTPTNVAQLGPTVAPVFPDTPLRDAEWSRAARATALPERWIVIGTRGGVDVFHKWTNAVSDTLDVTIAPDSDPTPPPDDSLPLQPSARWLTDFDEAERVGMAVRIGTADLLPGQSLAGGLDRLVAIGVDWTLAPDKAAAVLRQLFCSHVYSDGLSALDPGTPTNVTAAAGSAAPPSEDALVVALDPEHHPAASALTSGAADRLWHALGLTMTPDDLLTAIPGATAHEQDLASHLANVLWESTLGAYATDFLSPLLTDAAIALLRDHVRKHLYPGGPFPALRIGRQPYGVLPVVAPQRFSVPADARFDSELFNWLGKLRPFWEAGVGRAPRLARSANLDADLTQVLQTTPLSNTFRFRSVLGPLAVNATNGLARHASAQEQVTELLGTHLRWPSRPIIAGFTAHPTDHPLRVPLVDPKPIVSGARLSTNYLQEIADLARTSGTYDAIKAREDAKTLLEALVAHATARELHRADIRTIDRQRLATGVITALPDVGVMPASEYVGIEAVARPAATAGVLVTTPSEASRVVIAGITGQQTVRQFVTASVKRGAAVPPDYRSLGEMLASLELVAQRPADQIERALRGLLDAYAYRLDAWFTSLATRRLATVRGATPAGIHLGGYGWLDDLHPATAVTSQGFIHTPSLAQASTTAVLRSGHLAHNDAEHKALNLDLSSARVRTALQILDGVADGQPLAALLGYRFERAVRTRSLLLAKYILPIRRLAPLRPDGAPPPPTSPSENIAARDVVDGVTLLDRWRAERATLLGTLVPAPPATDQASLGAELDRLADLYDAVADVMVAEAVHQNVLGNNERAGAVLAALDRQDRPPAMDFVRTPRSGKSFAQRLLVLIGDETIPAPWATIPLDPRSNAEPRLNAWIARLLGDPKRVKFAGTVSGSAQKLTASLDQIGLSPLSLVMASQAAGHDAPSELEERLAHLFAAKVTSPNPSTEITLLDTPPAGADAKTIGLGAFRALARWIYALITSHRAATATDLSLPQDGNDEGLDPAQLATRADAVAAAYGTVITLLDGLIATPPTDVRVLRDALWRAAAFGLRTAVPAMPPLGPAATGNRDQLLTQARAVVADMRAAAARERALVTAFAAAPSPAPQAIVRHHTGRIRALLGDQFPVLPRFVARNASALTASQADRAALLAGDDLAPASWLQRMALVRQGAGRLSRVLTAAETLLSALAPKDILVLQLPRAAGERWLALPFAGTVPEAELAIAAASSGTINFAAPLAGLFCDAWSEVVPSREETTGIAFHYDAPAARPPQAVLIAVPPAMPNPAWSVDAIRDTVIEAHDLARIRGVGPRQLEWLGTVLPAICLPVSLSDDVPAVKFEGLVAKYAAANAATATILGKA